MPDGTRIPQTISLFNGYIDTTDTQLQTNNPATGNLYYIDYGISDLDAKSWHNQRLAWDTNIYPAYTNPATRTTVVNANLHTAIKDFHTFANPLLNKIIASDVTGNLEEHIFNFVLHRKDPVMPEGRILEVCAGTLVNVTGSLYEISCKGQTEFGRAHKVAGADSVQFAYMTAATQLATTPRATDAGMQTGLSTTAHFTFDFGEPAIGQWLYIYFRWYNTKHPEIAGGWSAPQLISIG